MFSSFTEPFIHNMSTCYAQKKQVGLFDGFTAYATITERMIDTRDKDSEQQILCSAHKCYDLKNNYKKISPVGD